MASAEEAELLVEALSLSVHYHPFCSKISCESCFLSSRGGSFYMHKSRAQGGYFPHGVEEEDVPLYDEEGREAGHGRLDDEQHLYPDASSRSTKI